MSAPIDVLSQRLLGAMQLGITLEAADGHTWVHCAELDWSFDDRLRAAGLSFNGKIYGGVLEALDTIDLALGMMGDHSLVWYFTLHSMGNTGCASDRITWVTAGRGGLC